MNIRVVPLIILAAAGLLSPAPATSQAVSSVTTAPAAGQNAGKHPYLAAAPSAEVQL